MELEGLTDELGELDIDELSDLDGELEMLELKLLEMGKLLNELDGLTEDEILELGLMKQMSWEN